MSDGVSSAALAAATESGSIPSTEYANNVLGTQHGDPVPANLKNGSSERPSHIPEKFWDAEKGEARWDDLAKSYTELERSQSGSKEQSTETAPEDTQNTDGNSEPTPSPVTTAIETFKASFAAKNGEVTDEDVSALEAMGLPRETISTYLAGLKALEAQSNAQAYAVAGGEEAFKAAQAWAAKDLSDADLESYNSMVSNPKTANQGIEWLMSRYKNARPSEGRRVEAVAANTSSGDLFRSTVQVTEAMSDKRYQTDPAFRQHVAEKLMRSKKAGTITTGATMHARGAR